MGEARSRSQLGFDPRAEGRPSCDTLLSYAASRLVAEPRGPRSVHH